MVLTVVANPFSYRTLPFDKEWQQRWKKKKQQQTKEIGWSIVYPTIGKVDSNTIIIIVDFQLHQILFFWHCTPITFKKGSMKIQELCCLIHFMRDYSQTHRLAWLLMEVHDTACDNLCHRHHRTISYPVKGKYLDIIVTESWLCTIGKAFCLFYISTFIPVGKTNNNNN